MEIEFSRPILLLLFLTYPFVIFFHFFVFRALKTRAFRFANFEAIKKITGSGFVTNKSRTFVSKNIPLLIVRLVALGLLILGLSGITLVLVGERVSDNLIIALDSSSSMLADDFNPNRFEAAKLSIISFLDNFSAEINIGLVTFSDATYIETSITDDKERLIRNVKNITISKIAGTDFNEAIITSVNLIQNPCCGGDGVILITDGRNTMGSSIQSAIAYAIEKDIRVYALGIATKSGGKYLNLESISTLDEETLKLITEKTGGEYFPIRDTKSFLEAFDEILQPKPDKIRYHFDIYCALVGLLLLVAEWILTNTKFNSIP